MQNTFSSGYLLFLSDMLTDDYDYVLVAHKCFQLQLI